MLYPIDVISEIKKINNTNPNLRDITCLIGCFEDTETLDTPTFCKTLPEAEAIFGDDDQYEGNAALKQIFHKDISGCLIVNCTTVSGSGSEATVNRNLTQSKIESALALVELIDFDILYFATELTDGMVEKILVVSKQNDNIKANKIIKTVSYEICRLIMENEDLFPNKPVIRNINPFFDVDMSLTRGQIMVNVNTEPVDFDLTDDIVDEVYELLSEDYIELV